MGQRLFFPPNVAGWPEGMAWLRGAAILERANFATWLCDLSSAASQGHFHDLAQNYRLRGDVAWLDAMAVLLSGTELASNTKDVLRERAGGEQDSAKRHARILAQLLSMPEGQVG
jgi:hypothetical protein